MEGQNLARLDHGRRPTKCTEEIKNPFSGLDGDHYLHGVVGVVQVLGDVHHLDAVDVSRRLEAGLLYVFPQILVKEYAFDIELLVNAHRNGYKIVEAPIELDFQTAGISSNVSPEDYIKMFLDTCSIFYRTNILNYYDTQHIKTEMDNQKTLTEDRLRDVHEVEYIPYKTHNKISVPLRKNKIESDGKLISKMNLND